MNNTTATQPTTVFSITEKDNWKTCSDPKAGYSISIPSKWVIQAVITSDVGLKLIAQDAARASEGFTPNMNLVLTKLEDPSMEAMKTFNKEAMIGAGIEVKQLKFKEVKIKDSTWYENYFNQNQQGIPLKSLQLMAIKGNTQFTLTFISHEHQFESCKEIFNDIKKTIRLL